GPASHFIGGGNVMLVGKALLPCSPKASKQRINPSSETSQTSFAPAARYAPISSSPSCVQTWTQISGARSNSMAPLYMDMSPCEAQATSATLTPAFVRTPQLIRATPPESWRCNSYAKLATSKPRRVVSGVSSILPRAFNSTLYGKLRSEESRQSSPQRAISASAVARFPMGKVYAAS